MDREIVDRFDASANRYRTERDVPPAVLDEVMAPVFEQRTADAAGRIGELTVPRANTAVETPALLPVVNPNVQTVAPARLADVFGAQALITNAYIIHGNDELRAAALDRGLHELLGFDGVVMTDSGAFQLAEYGDIDVTTPEILAFQRDAGSDIGTPVDLPTPPDVDRERAEAELDETSSRLDIAASFEAGEMLIAAPVQGSTYADLRERAGREARATGLDLFPIGAVVPLMTEYRFADVVEAVIAARRGLGVDAPVHLFGAGHPMLFALAAALGCDLFDSAAYALYARDDRYLTVRGTEQLGRLVHLPCECPVCVEWTVDDLREAPVDARHEALAEHNLYVSFGEIRRVRQAIRVGNLLELVEVRARAHPSMLDGYRALLERAGWLERHDPASKGTFFYSSAESARRPEVHRHHERLDRLDIPDRLLCWEGWTGAVDDIVAAGLDPAEFDAVWNIVPPFGPVPPALAQTYPLSAEVPGRIDIESQIAAAKAVARLADLHPGATIAVAYRNWPESARSRIPTRIATVDLTTVS